MLYLPNFAQNRFSNVNFHFCLILNNRALLIIRTDFRIVTRIIYYRLKKVVNENLFLDGSIFFFAHLIITTPPPLQILITTSVNLTEK